MTETPMNKFSKMFKSGNATMTTSSNGSLVFSFQTYGRVIMAGIDGSTGLPLILRYEPEATTPRVRTRSYISPDNNQIVQLGNNQTYNIFWIAVKEEYVE